MKYDGNFFIEICWDMFRDVMFVYDFLVIGIYWFKIIRKVIIEMYKLMFIGFNKIWVGVFFYYCLIDLDIGIQDF